MDEAGAYLKGKYADDKAEIERVNETLNGVLPVFAQFFDAGVWPYELREGHDVPRMTSYSYSTNAMIIFALEALGGRIQGSTLLPGMRHSGLKLPDASDAADLTACSRKAFQKLVRKVDGGAGSRPPDTLTYSGSFGSDDP